MDSSECVVLIPNLALDLTVQQNEQLYVFDPLALHHIFVKSQYIYEETDVFIMYVSSPLGVTRCGY